MTILISPRWSDWYWIVNDTNKTTKVYSTASNAYVNNNAAGFLTWLAGANFGAASNLGSSVTISGAADNGSGKTRLTVESSANFATGQFFYFGGNGAQQITVIDGTHIDLTGLAFGSYAATAVMQGASIIDTDANLRKYLNTVALRSNTAGANTVSGAVADIALTNPMALWQTISFAVPGKKVILPAMNAPNSVPIGYPFVTTAALGSKLTSSAGCYERGTSLPATFGVRVVPAHDELRNGPNNIGRESTSCRSTKSGSVHLIRVFRDSGRIFSLLFLLSHPSPIGLQAFRMYLPPKQHAALSPRLL